MFTRSITAALALSLVAAPTMLFAQEGKYEPVAVTIEVQDLDPADPADQVRYSIRLKAAARKACHLGLNERWAKAEEQRCIDEVLLNGGTWAN